MAPKTYGSGLRPRVKGLSGQAGRGRLDRGVAYPDSFQGRLGLQPRKNPSISWNQLPAMKVSAAHPPDTGHGRLMSTGQGQPGNHHDIKCAHKSAFVDTN